MNYLKILKKTLLWRGLRKLKYLFINIQNKKYNIKYNGKYLTPELKSDIQKSIKKSHYMYFKSERLANKLTDNWTGELNKPKNIKFIKDAVPVVMCANETFAPYMAVMLQSLLYFSNSQRIYHFIIFERGFSKKTEEKISNQVKKHENCFIDFIDVKDVFNEIPIHPGSIWTIDTFLRLFIPYWLDDYPKVIYLDSDMIMKSDIGILYDIDIQAYCIGASIDVWLNAKLHINNKYYTCFKRPVFIFLEDWTRYFNNGVLIFNTEKFKKRISYHELFKFAIYYTNRYSVHVVDQDIFNYFFKTDYYQLSTDWNYGWYRNEFGNQKYYASNEDSKIIHFVSSYKPWKDLQEINENIDTIAYRKFANTVPIFNDYMKN